MTILEELKLLSWGIGCHLLFGHKEFDFGELLVGDSQAAHLAIGLPVFVMPIGGKHQHHHLGVVDLVDEAVLFRDTTAPLVVAIAF